MPRWIPLLALVVACAPPQHRDPVPVRGGEPSLDAPKPSSPPKVQIALFDPTGVGAWGDAIALSPAPRELVAPCVAGHRFGFAWVRLDTQMEKASTTNLV